MRLYVGMDERNNIHKYRDFEVVTSIPKVGEEYEEGKVASVKKLRLDVEQGNPDADFFDAFEVDVEDEFGDSFEHYIAISNTERTETGILLTVTGLLPSSECLNRILRKWVHSEESFPCQFREEILEIAEDEDRDILEEYFGISPEKYEELAVSELVAGHPKSQRKDNDRPAICEKTFVDVCMDTMTFYGLVPYWWDKGCAANIDIDYDDLPEMPERTAEDLHPAVILGIFESIEEKEIIIDQKDGSFVSDYPNWYNLISTDSGECAKILTQITKIYGENFNQLRKDMGMTMRDFYDKLFIPQRTVEEWCSGKNPCKPYLRFMMADSLGYFKHRK